MAVLPALALSLLALAYWKLRIIDPGHVVVSPGRTVDLFTEHTPMVAYGFAELRAGDLPLWNPWQMAGLPFLAVPHTGLLYPGNLPYLFAPAPVATEIVLVLHLALAGVGMAWLVRAFGMGGAAQLSAGVTFMLSGWITSMVHQSALVSTMSWLPVTVLSIERCIRGARMAPLGLALATACQLLSGATEFALYNAYVSALFVLVRLLPSFWRGPWRVAAGRLGWLVAAVATGLLLTGPQLLPSLALVGESVRAPGALGDLPVLAMTAVPPGSFAFQWLICAGWVAVGFLPPLGLALGPSGSRSPALWGFAAVLSVLAALLVFGGDAYQAYRGSFFGGLFRYPNKWLHVFAFGQAILAGLAIERLVDWRRAGTPPAALLRHWRWPVAACLLLVGIAWPMAQGVTPLGTILALGALAGCVALPGRVARTSALGLLVALHAIALFARSDEPYLRPWSIPDAYEQEASLFDALRQRAGRGRIYLSPRLRLQAGLTLKQGMLTGNRVVLDYESLVPQRSADYFARAAGPSAAVHFGAGEPRPDIGAFLAGFYSLDESSHFELMDLASTKLYVLKPGEPLDTHFARRIFGPEQSSEVVPVMKTERYRVYERRSALPRARWVGSVRFVAPADGAAGTAVLDVLEAPDFDPREEVVLEAPGAPGRVRGPAAGGRARIVVDEEERVEVEVDATAAGWLVLADAFDSGWRASIGGREVSVQRANHLFRAVAVEPGQSRVRFDYRPSSFRAGLAAGALGALALVVLAWRARLRTA